MGLGEFWGKVKDSESEQANKDEEQTPRDKAIEGEKTARKVMRRVKRRALRTL